MPYLTCKETTCVYHWMWLSSVILVGNCNSKNRHSALGDSVPISPVQTLLYCRPRFPFPFPPPSYPGKILEPPGAVYLQESIFISHWHVSNHLQGESVEAGCSSVGSSAWIVEHYWCVLECGEGAPVSFASSATVESKKSRQSANEGFVSPASLWNALCFTLSVRMVNVVQPPVSSLLLHARVADGVSAHLWKHLGN